MTEKTFKDVDRTRVEDKGIRRDDWPMHRTTA